MRNGCQPASAPAVADLRQRWLQQLAQQPVIAVIRPPDQPRGYAMAQAVARAGIRLIEIAWNPPTVSDGQLEADLISKLRHSLPHCQIGAGTLLDQTTLQQAIAAGSQFCFMPHVAVDLIHTAGQQGVPVIPGALSPTEIVTAWQAGATSVKVFPIQAMGGLTYLHNLRGPLGHIPLIPTGGVTVENAVTFLRAGAVAVGLAGSLFPAAAIAGENWAEVEQRAAALLQAIQTREPTAQ